MNGKYRRVEKLEQAARQHSGVAGTFWSWWSGLTEDQRTAYAEDAHQRTMARVERIVRRMEEDGETVPVSEEEIAQIVAETRAGIRQIIEEGTEGEIWT